MERVNLPREDPMRMRTVLLALALTLAAIIAIGCGIPTLPLP